MRDLGLTKWDTGSCWCGLLVFVFGVGDGDRWMDAFISNYEKKKNEMALQRFALNSERLTLEVCPRGFFRLGYLGSHFIRGVRRTGRKCAASRTSTYRATYYLPTYLFPSTPCTSSWLERLDDGIKCPIYSLPLLYPPMLVVCSEYQLLYASMVCMACMACTYVCSVSWKELRALGIATKRMKRMTNVVVRNSGIHIFLEVFAVLLV